MFKIPSLKKASSISQFIKDYSEVLKVNFGPEKMKLWAQSLGIQSRSNFKSYTIGTRSLPAKVQRQMSLSMDFSDEQVRILKDPLAPKDITEEADKYFISEDFFASPINTVILNLCGIKAMIDEKQICHILQGLYDAEQIQSSIQMLLSHKLIQHREDRSLERIFEGRIVTLPGQKSNHSRHYFKSSYAMADMAWEFPLDIREMGSFTFRMNSSNLLKMKDLVRNFRSDLCRLGASTGKSDSVFHCTIATFPIYLERETQAN